MKKTLTEQWREGKLPENTYYVRFICGRYGIYEFEQFKGFGFDNDLAYIKEVLAPVPSYDKIKEMSQRVGRLELDNGVLDDELKELATKNDTLAMENGRLEKKLKIAKKALKDIQVRSQRNWDEYNCMSRATRALYDIEMEGIK